MAQIIPVFDQIINGTGTVGTETWVNLGSITSGQKIWVGYATFGAIDKNLQFELRSNLTGQSTGTIATTDLHDYSGAQAGSSVDRDFYWGGALATMTVTGSGSEKLWLRVTGQGNSISSFEYIIRYSLY